ncbi:hypothetical protein U1Q18_001172, partial [Sarracenia purpurea var. burkii]
VVLRLVMVMFFVVLHQGDSEESEQRSKIEEQNRRKISKIEERNRRWRNQN